MAFRVAQDRGWILSSIKDILYIAEMMSGREILIHGSFLRSALRSGGKIFSWRAANQSEINRFRAKIGGAS
jgi:hypothetical protein